MNWDTVTEFRHRGASNTFCITVKHHTIDEKYCSPGEGPHRWALYVYIYPNHTMFQEFDGNTHIYQKACENMPLHGGCSYVRYHLDEKDKTKPSSVQVGCDYNHLHDEFYTHLPLADFKGSSVERDAKVLFDYMTRRETVPNEQDDAE